MITRYFNHIETDYQALTVTKTSECSDKLRDEIRWYLEIPEALRTIIPRVKGLSLGEAPFITLDLIDSSTIGEDFAGGKYERETWVEILEQIYALLQRFSVYSGTLPERCQEEMYISKTSARVMVLLDQHVGIREIHKRGYMLLNGKWVECPINIFERHSSKILTLLDKPEVHVIHGDLCFSNMFYVPKEEAQIKVIDPRGSFGIRGLYGDSRYDWAKVRHSLSGYEQVIRGYYALSRNNHHLDFSLSTTDFHRDLRHHWDMMAGKMVEQVRVIEALLFLSLLPLHRDDPERQLALYALGARIMAEASTAL